MLGMTVVFKLIGNTFVFVKRGWVYIITNKKKSVLYTGVSSNISGRLQKHVDEHYKGFASKYACLPVGRAANTLYTTNNSTASLTQ